MIKHTSTIPLTQTQADRILDYLRNNTIQEYCALTHGYTHSYELKGLPDFRLMEGGIVPMHNDNRPAYRPILMLDNPGNSYVIRGADQKFSSQKRGTLIILDIDAQHEVRSKDPNGRHEVRSKDPNGRHGPWSGLVWSVRGQPLLKEFWSVESAAKDAEEWMIWLIGYIKEKINA